MHWGVTAPLILKTINLYKMDRVTEITIEIASISEERNQLKDSFMNCMREHQRIGVAIPEEINSLVPKMIKCRERMEELLNEIDTILNLK